MVARFQATRHRGNNDEDSAAASLFDLDIATGRERKICEGRFADWSPDGRQLAFCRDGAKTSNAGVYPGSKLLIAKSDGSDPQELGDGQWPSWSPDGKKIAFCINDEEHVPTLWTIDVATKHREELGVGFYRAQWAGDGQSVVSNGLAISAKGVRRVPARFWLDRSKVEFFLLDRDTPFSPCVSRDGNTMVLIVDSKEHKNFWPGGE